MELRIARVQIFACRFFFFYVHGAVNNNAYEFFSSAGVTSPAVVTTTTVSDKTSTSTTERIKVSSNAPDSGPPLLHQAALRDAAVETDPSDTKNQSIDGPSLPVVRTLWGFLWSRFPDGRDNDHGFERQLRLAREV